MTFISLTLTFTYQYRIAYHILRTKQLKNKSRQALYSLPGQVAVIEPVTVF